MNYTKTYQNPLITRYASDIMSYIFSAEKRYRIWRRLWVVLAREEAKLGVPIKEEQIKELEANQDNINYEDALYYEKKTRHEVMGHIHAYAKQCKKAKGIIHLGATSAYVMDNSDIIQMKEALTLVKDRLLVLISVLKDFSLKYKSLATLGYTHFQTAQPTTVGKRASLWLQDIIYDFRQLEYVLKELPFRGAKGTSGSQNSFLKLFNNDKTKVKKLDDAITKVMGFDKKAIVTGQTYSRKWDYFVLSVLSGVAQSAHKFSNDMRLLQHLGELEEPFEAEQVGSSAMPYKRNPMRSERIASLSRYVLNLLQNTSMTASLQWFERTLDDSANKRLSIPEAFLAIDAVLMLYIDVIVGLDVNEAVIKRRLCEELPFMVTEDIIVEAVNRGCDRQEIHEEIRNIAIHSAKTVKERGEANPFVQLLSDSKKIPLSKDEIKSFLEPNKLIGLSSEQVDNFIEEEVIKILKANPLKEELKVVSITV